MGNHDMLVRALVLGATRQAEATGLAPIAGIGSAAASPTPPSPDLGRFAKLWHPFRRNGHAPVQAPRLSNLSAALG